MSSTAPRTTTFDTAAHLAHAARQAQERRYDEFVIVDADAHHYETESWAEITSYVDDPVVKELSQAVLARVSGSGVLIPTHVGDQDVSGRILRYQLRRREEVEEDRPRDVVLVERAARQMGVTYTCLFPTPMLNLGLHPQVEVEVAFARAYARWMTERVLPASGSIKAQLYLPFNDPDACLGLVEEFGDKPGVVGFMVTSVRYAPVHHNRYMKLYGAMEERGLPLGFHSGFSWSNNDSFMQLNRFISVHALGFAFSNMVHLTNWVINGLPERFPKLKVIWIESGLAWIPFMMQRLDNEYLMRSSEAPLLKRKPSEYMRGFYYTTQPLDCTDPGALQVTFDMIHAETQLLFSSDYPHWDFNLPSVVYDVPFLSEGAKRRILGQNACEVFGLPWRSVERGAAGEPHRPAAREG